METRFEELDHPADIAMRVYGRDMAELFRNAAYGMSQLARPTRNPAPDTVQELVLDALDYESLLVDWLNELLYLYEVEGFFYCAAELGDLTPTALRAQVHLARGIEVSKVIKAATYNDLVITQTAAGSYTTAVVFDV